MFKKSTGKGISIPAGIGLGVLLSMGITLAGAAVAAYLLSSEKMAVSGVGWCALVILAAASFAGGILAAGLAKVNRMPVCLAVGAGYVLLLLGCTALFFGGQYEGFLATVITVTVGSLGAGFVGLKGKKTSIRRKKIPSYR